MVYLRGFGAMAFADCDGSAASRRKYLPICCILCRRQTGVFGTWSIYSSRASRHGKKEGLTQLGIHKNRAMDS